MWVLGRVHKGMGPGWLLWTLTKPVPPRWVGGIPMGFPFMENQHILQIYFCWWTLLNCTVARPVARPWNPEHELMTSIQKNPSTQYLITMLFSTNDSSTIPMRCKHTISKHVLNNGDPLVANKKAHDTAKLTPASLAKAPNTTQVSKLANFASQTAWDTHCQACAEVVDDEDNLHLCKAVPINPSHIIELADGSDDDMPGLEAVNDNEDSDEEEEKTNHEGPAESAEAELSGLSSRSISKKIVNSILEQLSKDWNSPIYVFCKPTPSICYIMVGTFTWHGLSHSLRHWVKGFWVLSTKSKKDLESSWWEW